MAAKVITIKPKPVLKWLLILILLPFRQLAQELVPDPGFEALRYCPNGISMLNYSVFWYSPSQGTPDLFNTCGGRSSQVCVPKNLCGKQKPHEGQGYGGLILYEYQYWDYKEYLQTELTTSMVKGATYRLSFKISLADNSMYAIDKIQALFTEDAFYFKSHRTITRFTPEITFEGPDNGFFTQRKNWVTLTYDYIAKGNERFLTIGNFVPDQYGKRKELRKETNVPSAYYFLDAISVELIKPTTFTDEELQLFEEQKTDSLKEGNIFTLKTIHFETDKDVLLPASFRDLDKVAGILQQYTFMELEIRGHTDDQASEEHNQDLSERRARSVRRYLLSKGIEDHRLTTIGFGESMPIADNKTEEGRAVNRRVEFRIVKR